MKLSAAEGVRTMRVSIVPGTQWRIVARLPLLGPLIGWTRQEGDDFMRRIWIKADDHNGQPAVLALTVRWIPHTFANGELKKGHVEPGTVKLWRICAAAMQDNVPPALERFAIADIRCDAGNRGVVRMVSLHLARRLDSQGPGTQLDLPEPLPIDEYDPLATGPRTQELRFSDIFPDLNPDLAAQDWFDALETRIEAQRKPRPPGEARPTPKERAARMELCEVPALIERKTGPLLRFAAACCRHPGVNLDRDLADRALGALAQQATEEFGLDLALMLGDQIYADATAGIIDAEDRLEKYTRRYDESFDSPGFRRLARRVPIYMAADDHEIRDNWPKDTVPPGATNDVKQLFLRMERWAVQLFLAHQRCHGPDNPAWAPKRQGSNYWYAFETAGLPFFCFDTRFERRRDGSELIEDYQLDCFRAWLDNVCSKKTWDKPKFILSGSVFAPAEQAFAGEPRYARRADSWLGYPDRRAEVMREIVKRGAQNVVFMSGDLHCAALASLHVSGKAADLRCYAVVAPPFYAPFLFANLPSRGVERRETFYVDRMKVDCRASALDTAGFAVLSVTSPASGEDPLDWTIRVDFHRDRWQRDATDNYRAASAAGLACSALLRRGEVEWLW